MARTRSRGGTYPRNGVSPAAGKVAAEPGKDQERKQDHRDRVQRMAEEQDELLDERDLDEHEATAEREEIRRRRALRVIPAAPPSPPLG